MGVFPAVEMVHDELETRYAVKRVGPCQGVTEQFFAIGTERKVQHPLVQRILSVRMALSCPLPAATAARH